MKQLILVAMAVMCMVFTSCSEDETITITYQYEMYAGLGKDTKVGAEAPGLSYLLNETEKEIKKLNDGLTTISVTGTGKDETSAKEDAKNQAITEYDKRAEQLFVSLLNIQSSFNTNRSLEADNIKTETGYWVKLNAGVYLIEKGQPADIIKEDGDYKMEAIGGTDYSL